MDKARLRAVLEQVGDGSLAVDRAVDELSGLSGSDLGFANLDTHRAVRTGLPEAIFGQGKSAEQIVAIVRRLADHGQDGLVTRVEVDKARAVVGALPSCEWHETARILHYRTGQAEAPKVRGPIAVVCAGTSDLPVAEEAAVVAEAYGNPVLRVRDVGVAGIHRVLLRQEALRQASVLIVVAGMEGALASVVAGLVSRPVIAVPTSIGYGASFGGLAALLGMLNSCAPGVSVVNIDNGYGAAVQASLINRLEG